MLYDDNNRQASLIHSHDDDDDDYNIADPFVRSIETVIEDLGVSA